MVDVVLCKTRSAKPERAWALMVRDFGSGIEVEWTTLCFMDEMSAHTLNGENISFWDGNPEEKEEARQLRIEHPGLREAWDNYKLLKALVSKK